MFNDDFRKIKFEVFDISKFSYNLVFNGILDADKFYKTSTINRKLNLVKLHLCLQLLNCGMSKNIVSL